MQVEYDLSKLKARQNPYAEELNQQVTIDLSADIVAYFQEIAKEVGIPYESLIKFYLRDCVSQQRRIRFSWEEEETQ